MAETMSLPPRSASLKGRVAPNSVYEFHTLKVGGDPMLFTLPSKDENPDERRLAERRFRSAATAYARRVNATINVRILPDDHNTIGAWRTA